MSGSPEMALQYRFMKATSGNTSCWNDWYTITNCICTMSYMWVYTDPLGCLVYLI